MKTCPECNREVEELLSRDEIWRILSESSILLEKYENKDLIVGDENKDICWNCFCSTIENYLGDAIDFEEQIKIRKEYNESWAPEFVGTLHNIMNAAMVHTCIRCGNSTLGIPYNSLNPESKKISRKLLKSAGLTLKDIKRVICLCKSCSYSEIEDYQNQKRAKLKPIPKDEAHLLIRNFLSKVDEINKDSLYKSQIGACAVIGSYLSNNEKVKDIDIALFNTWKEEPPTNMNGTNETLLEALENRNRLDSELNTIINKSVDSEYFHFHSWSILWHGKLKEQKEKTPFYYEFFYVHPKYTKERLQKVIDSRVQHVLQNPEALIID